MKSRLLLDVVVGQGPTVFKLLSGEDQALLIRRNAFLVLNFRLYIIDCIRRFDLKSDGLSGEGLDKDLHSATKTKDQVKGGFLLDVVIAQGSAILKLLAGED